MGSEKLKPIEHKFKALFFSVFKTFLKRGQAEFKPLDGKVLRRVLFLRPEKIGDMVISFPVFDGLRKAYPHIKISLLASPKNIAIIKDDPRFERIYLYRKRPWKDLATLLAMRQGGYDCVVDMIGDDSVTALFLSQMSAPGKPRIGVGKVKYREFYDYNYDHRLNNTGHIIDNTLKLLKAFGIDSDNLPRYAEPHIKLEDDKRARDFIDKITDGNRILLKVGYNLSAGSPTRIWAEEKSVKLLRNILAEHSGCRVILFSTPVERERAVRLKQLLNGRVDVVPDSLSLTGAAAIIKYLDILITPDTSLVHVARSFRVPVVGLYSRYMKNFLLWRPYGQKTGAVVSGCDGNIFDISVEQVIQAFSQTVTEQKGVG